MPSWITLNDTTVRIDHILAIEMTMEGDECIFMVQFRFIPMMKVNLHATGGKWLYMICNEGIKETMSGGEYYEQL
uniref:Uncharacterized protein n=1 Tax=viral metagenome TaxID=1070528 RepID=A0A6C0KVN3_9ZZZZ